MRFCSPSGAAVALGSAILDDTAFVRSFLALSNQRLREAHVYSASVLDGARIKYMRGYVDFLPSNSLIWSVNGRGGL